MSAANRIVITALLSVLIAFSLSWLPRLGDRYGSFEPVLSTTKSGIQQLNQQNLVDIMIELPLALRMRRVELNRSILSIDMNVPSSSDPAKVYGDFYEIAHMALKRTSNVSRVLIRGLDPAGGQLLIAMDARRDQWSGSPQLHKDNPDALHKFMTERFSMTFTSKWKERYEVQN